MVAEKEYCYSDNAKCCNNTPTGAPEAGQDSTARFSLLVIEIPRAELREYNGNMSGKVKLPVELRQTIR